MTRVKRPLIRVFLLVAVLGQAGIRYITEDLIKKVSRADSLDVITTLNLTLAREGGKKIKVGFSLCNTLLAISNGTRLNTKY